MALDAAIVGPGNIGTDLMLKILARGEAINLQRMIGIYPVKESEGLQVATAHGIGVGTKGIDSVKEYAHDIDLIFEATSAEVHQRHAPVYEELGIFAIDLTPAAIGPYVVPVVNFEEVNPKTSNINLVSCGGQATVPVVHGVNRVTEVRYSEIVSTIASESAGPGTRQNIDEFTQTTAAGLEQIGGAKSGKAIIILNPGEPPITMSNTIYTIVPESTEMGKVRASVREIEEAVQAYVPGYSVTLEPVVKQQEDVGFDLGGDLIVTTMIEVEGEGRFLPTYAGNLDIMTSAALGTAERIAKKPEMQVSRGRS